MNKFSSYLRKKKPLLKELVERLNSEYEFASVLGCDVSGKTYRVDKNNTSIKPTGEGQCGFVARCFYKGIYLEHSFSDIDKKSIDLIVNEFAKLRDLKVNEEKINAKCIKEEELVKKFKRSDNKKQYSDDEIISILKSYCEKGLKRNDKIINCLTRFEFNEYSKVYISAKRDLEQYYTWDYYSCFAIARDKANIKQYYIGAGDNHAQVCLEELGNKINEACDIAVELLDSTLPVPGVYTIITDPSITGLFAHEAFGHGLEMDMFVKDRAKSVDYIGKEVASPLLTMHDGASATLSAASYFFDDEGALASDTVIVKDGILQGGICDSISAAILNYHPTGNGRRESYKRKAYTRMTNTFFSKKNSSLDKMIKSVKHGYYVQQTDNGMEDPKNWGIQCSACFGREIVDGKFTGKIIAPVVMSGYVIDFLKSISAIANNEIVIGSGHCGKGHKEWVAVSDGGASIKAEVKIG